MRVNIPTKDIENVSIMKPSKNGKLNSEGMPNPKSMLRMVDAIAGMNERMKAALNASKRREPSQISVGWVMPA